LSNEQWISIGELRVMRAPAVLTAYGLGSCLAVVLYDATVRVGGLAHALLPTPQSGHTDRPGKFVTSAIHEMVAQMEGLGAQRQHIGARLFGGAQMFRPLQPLIEESIGQRNVRAARAALLSLQIPLTGEDVGGSNGRTIEFDLGDGSVVVRSMLNDGKLSRFSFSPNQEAP
jgi:chemotaxis protein CheD